MAILDGRKGLRRETVSALNSLFGVLAITSPMSIMGTTMLFDAAGSLGSPALLMIGLAIWSYPPVFVLAWFASRRALQRRTSRALAVPIALLPGVNVFLGLGATIWYWMGCSQHVIC